MEKEERWVRSIPGLLANFMQGFGRKGTGGACSESLGPV